MKIGDNLLKINKQMHIIGFLVIVIVSSLPIVFILFGLTDSPEKTNELTELGLEMQYTNRGFSISDNGKSFDRNGLSKESKSFISYFGSLKIRYDSAFLISVFIVSVTAFIISEYNFYKLKSKKYGFIYNKIPISKNEYFFETAVLYNFFLVLAYFVLLLLIKKYAAEISERGIFVDRAFLTIRAAEAFGLVILMFNLKILFQSLVRNIYFALVFWIFASALVFVFLKIEVSLCFVFIILSFLFSYFIFSKKDFMGGRFL